MACDEKLAVRIRRSIVTSCLAAVLLATSARAQSPASGPEIVTTGSGSVVLPPDRAIVRVGVATRAATASAASLPNGPLVARVQDTLRVLGFTDRAARPISFGVVPNYDYQNGRRLIDYEARTTIEVTLQDVAALGRLLDAVLAAGATDITSITFESDSSAKVRGRALATALEAARADAEALANAAGGRLGTLRLVTTTPDYATVAMRSTEYSAVGMLAGISTVRRDVIVSVMIQARWAFVPRS